MVVALNGWTFDPYPSVDEAEAAVQAMASGTWDEDSTADWLRPMLRAGHRRSVPRSEASAQAVAAEHYALAGQDSVDSIRRHASEITNCPTWDFWWD